MSVRPPAYETMSETEWEQFKATAFPSLLRDYLIHAVAWTSKDAQQVLGLSFLEANIAYEIGIIAAFWPSEDDYRRWPLLRHAWKERVNHLPRTLLTRNYQPRGPLEPHELIAMGEELISDIGAAGQLGMSYGEFSAARRTGRLEGLKRVGRTRPGSRGYRLRDVDALRCRRENAGPSRYAIPDATPEQ